MTDDELRALVARNAQTIERLEGITERIEGITERNAIATERLEKKTDTLDRQLGLLAQQSQKRTDALDRQIGLISQQVQLLADSQVINENRLTSADRLMNGVYDILQTYAREQAERSALIDQQIQALIDERRRS